MLELIVTIALAGASTPEAEALRAAQRYVDAVYRGDGKAACRLLDAEGREELGGLDARGSCVRVIEDSRGLRTSVVGFERQSPTQAWAQISAGQDDGGSMPIRLHGDRWLISAG